MNPTDHALRNGVDGIGFLAAQPHPDYSVFMLKNFPDCFTAQTPLGRKLANPEVPFKSGISQTLSLLVYCNVNKPVSSTSFRLEFTTPATFAK